MFPTAAVQEVAEKEEKERVELERELPAVMRSPPPFPDAEQDVIVRELSESL